MHRQLIIGQILCLAGLLLLLAFVPFMPQVTGIPPHRVAEMCVFWCGQWLLVVGMGLTLGAAATTGGRYPALAAVGVLLAFAVCFVSLTNLTFSSIQGVGLRMPGEHSWRLFPKVVGYLLAVPLLVSTYLQLLVLASTAMSATTPVAMRRPRIARNVLLVMLIAFSAMFAATVLLFVMDRWYAVLSVVATWIATVFFLAAGIEQLAFAISIERVRGAQEGV